MQWELREWRAAAAAALLIAAGGCQAVHLHFGGRYYVDGNETPAASQPADGPADGRALHVELRREERP